MAKPKKFECRTIDPQYFSKGQLKFYAFLVPLAIFMIIPVVFIINQAFKTLGELYAFPPTIFVRNPTIQNFDDLFSLSSTTGIPMSRYLLNSIFITVLTVVLNMMITIFAAYALSKKKFKLKSLMLEINQLALMFVATAVAVPRYLIMVNIGLTNNWLAHILPLIAMPVGLFLLKQFVDQIPDSLIEAAFIDGASESLIVRKIIIPLTKPALATTVVLTFQQAWGSVEASNNFITKDSMRTLSYYLTSISTNNAVAAAGMVAAASLILFLPNLIIFVAMQSQVMNTMSHSGIK